MARTKLHITQDRHGFWMLCAQSGRSRPKLLSQHFPAPEPLILSAMELSRGGLFDKAAILIDSEKKRLPDNIKKWPAIQGHSKPVAVKL